MPSPRLMSRMAASKSPSLRGRERFGRRADRADDRTAALAETFLDHHGDQRLILDQQHAPAGRRQVRRRIGAAIGARHVPPSPSPRTMRFALRDR